MILEIKCTKHAAHEDLQAVLTEYQRAFSHERYEIFRTYCTVDVFFFFSSRRRHTRCLSDWSSDVCSSDLAQAHARGIAHLPRAAPRGCVRLRCRAQTRVPLRARLACQLAGGGIEAREIITEIGRASCRERV